MQHDVGLLWVFRVKSVRSFGSFIWRLCVRVCVQAATLSDQLAVEL